MEVKITETQYRALMDIYGPPANVHGMIMLSKDDRGKQVLTGDEKDFNDLLALIGEEVGEGFCSKTNERHLVALCKKIDPASLDWIGK